MGRFLILITLLLSGGFKVWDCTYDLMKYLCLNAEGRFRGKKVLDLGCGNGFLGILSIYLGAAEVHFQDYNESVIRNITIPNALKNLEKLGDLPEKCKFYAGDWGSFSDLNTFKYDVILTAATIYNTKCYGKLCSVFKNNLEPSGTVILAAKSHYFGWGGGTRQFEDYLKNDSTFQTRTLWTCSEGVQQDIIEIKFEIKDGDSVVVNKQIRQNVSVETFTMLPFDISLFNELARHFLTVSNAVGDDWFIEKYDNSNSVELILRKRVTICRENINDSDQVNDSDESDELQLEDDVLGDERGTDIVTWDYQIIFSESFCSPVLYFNASDANGRTLSLDSLCIETKSNFGVITQQMHPIFNFPFYYVHPCDMATNTGWFRLAQETATNALVTWLSTVASVVKLTVLEDYSHFKFDYRNILENFKE